MELLLKRLDLSAPTSLRRGSAILAIAVAASLICGCQPPSSPRDASSHRPIVDGPGDQSDAEAYADEVSAAVAANPQLYSAAPGSYIDPESVPNFGDEDPSAAFMPHEEPFTSPRQSRTTTSRGVYIPSGRSYSTPCTDDCAGHDAGHEWAEHNDIAHPDQCGGNSQSFIDGCEDYAREQQASLIEDEECEDLDEDGLCD